MIKAETPLLSRRILAAALTAIAITAGCSGSELEASDKTGYYENPDDEEIIFLDGGRADLELTSSASDNGDGTFTISGSLVSLDKNDVGGPTISIGLSDGVELVPVPEDCEETDAGFGCYFADFLFTDGPLPTDPEPFEFSVSVDPSAVDPSVVLTATSSSNPVDNDPDPTNNVITHALDEN